MIGQARYYGISGFIFWGEMTYATVIINTHTNLTWCRSDGEGCSGTSWYLLEEAIDHELGHALGLAHPVQGPNSWAVMQCYQAQLEQTTVLSDDYTGGKTYYAGHPNDFGNPGSSPC